MQQRREKSIDPARNQTLGIHKFYFLFLFFFLFLDIQPDTVLIDQPLQ
jgi:hypothetical protein